MFELNLNEFNWRSFMKHWNRFGILILLINCLNPDIADSQIGLDFETGLIQSGYNNVQIPGDLGTRFSLSEDLKSEAPLFFRFRLNYALNDKSTLSLLIAPFTIRSTGQSNNTIRFHEAEFPADTDLDAVFRFNSYRLTYIREFVNRESFEFDLGLTGKIRDAKIGLKSGTLESVKKNVGFVPLIYFRLHWTMTPSFGLLLSGDALAAPQGRAEDVLAALTYGKSDRFRMKIGYRILEGGADNEEVYTFSLFHYFVVGLTIQR